ncbi:MAG: D-2-hydroxyacid dehydrogenase [Alphaproteobacteria bacterium]|nr:D-2-hydroxyacid dehydrogenase [Alphaproteobacteria bacterium]
MAVKKLHLHIKNNRAGEEVFRTTPALYRAAARRHPETARRIRVSIDWDLDNFELAMRTADALVTWDLPQQDLRQRAPGLKYIHIIGAGVEHLAPFDWLPRGLTLCNNSGVHGDKAEDYARMALAMLNNNLPKYATDQRRKTWRPVFATGIAGKTLAVIGLGAMGGALARAGKSLGLNVIGLRRSGKPTRQVREVFPPGKLKQVLKRADFVALTLPLTPETKGLLDGQALDQMKPGAGLINMGRAGVLDHRALAARLRDGRLGGAILDVHEMEPLPKSARIWTAPNLILTPHVSSDDDLTYVPRTLDLVFENMARLLAGKPLRNRVDPVLGY